MDKARARQLYELADRLSKIDESSLSPEQVAERKRMITMLHGELTKNKVEESGVDRAEYFAQKLPAGLTTEDEILDAAYEIAKQELGDKQARYYFAYDEDFAGDLLGYYQHHQQAQGYNESQEQSQEDVIQQEAYERLYKVFDFSKFKAE